MIGLAAMAGTILLQAPEEDAFWTFMALMDNHLRGYYAQNSVQLIVDSRLLQRALESLDSALSKRLFVSAPGRRANCCMTESYRRLTCALIPSSCASLGSARCSRTRSPTGSCIASGICLCVKARTCTP